MALSLIIPALEETSAGISDQEDLYSPGYLTINLQPEAITTVARVGGLTHNSSPNFGTSQQAQIGLPFYHLSNSIVWDQ